MEDSAAAVISIVTTIAIPTQIHVTITLSCSIKVVQLCTNSSYCCWVLFCTMVDFTVAGGKASHNFCQRQAPELSCCVIYSTHVQGGNHALNFRTGSCSVTFRLFPNLLKFEIYWFIIITTYNTYIVVGSVKLSQTTVAYSCSLANSIQSNQVKVTNPFYCDNFTAPSCFPFYKFSSSLHVILFLNIVRKCNSCLMSMQIPLTRNIQQCVFNKALTALFTQIRQMCVLCLSVCHSPKRVCSKLPIPFSILPGDFIALLIAPRIPFNAFTFEC